MRAGEIIERIRHMLKVKDCKHVAGALVDLLKEEYYIRTKTDEFVIKAVEKGEQFNKYTAVLNVEELEGTPLSLIHI